MKDPINTESVDDILEIVEDEAEIDIPREDIKDRILERNRNFYQNAPMEDINKNFLVEIMTIRKVMETVGKRKASDELESVIDILEEEL
jgi:hypothetical protein